MIPHSDGMAGGDDANGGLNTLIITGDAHLHIDQRYEQHVQ